MVNLYRCLILIVYVVLLGVVLSAAIHQYTSSSTNSNGDPSLTLNQQVRDTISCGLNANFNSSFDLYSNISVNITNLTNNVMDRFYVLENNTSFLSIYSKYSSSFGVRGVFNFNASQFNKSDPIGLTLDSFYFTFYDIYDYTNSNFVKYDQACSVSFSIDIGTGKIAGPTLSINRISYA